MGTIERSVVPLIFHTGKGIMGSQDIDQSVKRFSVKVQRYNELRIWLGFGWAYCGHCKRRRNWVDCVHVIYDPEGFLKHHFEDVHLCHSCAVDAKIKRCHDKGWISLRDDVNW